MQVGPVQGVLRPSRRALGLATDELLKVLLHEGGIGEGPIQDGFSQPTDRCLPTAVHREPSSKSLATTLAGHAYVDETACCPLPSEVHAWKTRRRDSRIVEG